jgi:hypothetical protein
MITSVPGLIASATNAGARRSPTTELARSSVHACLSADVTS